jgi:hypothetical protein
MCPYTATQLLWGARAMLNKTQIVPNIKHTRILRKALDNLNATTSTEDRTKEWFDIFEVLCTFFDPILDDVLLISAFETYAKACLLKQGYFVHNIKRPKNLTLVQKREPVSLEEVTHYKNVEFFEKTLGIELLTQDNYIKLYPFTEDTTKGLNTVRQRRNTVHFYVGVAWAIDNELISFVEELNEKIPSEEELIKQLGLS